MENKELIFDMDGTIADLYNVPNWLEQLRASDPKPYATAKPLYDMDTLNLILSMLKDCGYRIKVVSWGSKNSTSEYLEEVKKAKIQWLNRYNFPADEIYIVPYGDPKENYASINSILIDDNSEVCEAFLNSAKGILKRQVIDATKNIMERLVDLLTNDN